MKKSQFIKKSFWVGVLAVICLSFVSISMAVGGPQPKPACGTNGPLGVTGPTPNTYSYVQTSAGSTSGSLTVQSPAPLINPSCDSTLPYVYGNGNSGAEISISVAIIGATDVGTDLPVSAATLTAITNALSNYRL